MLKLVLVIAAGVAVAVGTIMVVKIGPRNVIGMLRYDTRREGKLKIGDVAPDVPLAALDGTHAAPLLAEHRGLPLVLVFGSFT